MNLLPMPAPESPIHGRRNVLLIDARQVMGELRCTILRNRGVDVDFASRLSTARTFWNRNRYDLVLFDFRQDPELVNELFEKMKNDKPHQRVAFFVGGPLYWSLSPAKSTAPGHSPAGSAV